MKIIKLNLKKAVRAIKEGKILVCPTDTVYGLLCDATNQRAVNRLFKIKKRSRKKPIPIFVKDIKTAKELAKINSEQEKFLREVWPGKTTVILKPKRKFPKGIGQPKKEIGLRIPNHNWLLSLAKQLNRHLAETSANISGQPPSTKIKEVLRQFKGQKYQPDLVIDAGNLKKSRPSKVIDLTVLPPKVLRL